MRTHWKRLVVSLGSAAFLLAGAPGLAATQSDENAPPKHHSKLKGAAVGGAGGALVGGKKGAAVGAAGGALYQHHQNKKEAKGRAAPTGR